MAAPMPVETAEPQAMTAAPQILPLADEPVGPDDLLVKAVGAMIQREGRDTASGRSGRL
jgi:hypothetical protein